MNIDDPRIRFGLFLHRHATKIMVACMGIYLLLWFFGRSDIGLIPCVLSLATFIATIWTDRRYLRPADAELDMMFNAPDDSVVERFKVIAADFNVLSAFEDELDALEEITFDALNDAMDRACRRVRSQSFSDLAAADMAKKPSDESTFVEDEIKRYRWMTMLSGGVFPITGVGILYWFNAGDAPQGLQGVASVVTVLGWITIVGGGIIFLLSAFLWRQALNARHAVRLVEGQAREATQGEIREWREAAQGHGGVARFDSYLNTCERPLLIRDLARALQLSIGRKKH